MPSFLGCARTCSACSKLFMKMQSTLLGCMNGLQLWVTEECSCAVVHTEVRSAIRHGPPVPLFH